MENKYEFIEHTADIGVRVWGATKEELFVHAAEALSALLVEKAAGEPAHREIVLEADTEEDLLAAWLNELISLFFSFSFLFGSAGLIFTEQAAGRKFSAEVQGIVIDPAGTVMNREVKAATYYDLRIVHDREGYSVTIIFDV